MPKLDLYFFPACPFCQMVLTKIEQNKIKVGMKDIHADSENLEKLMADTGRKTVPCLYIDGKPMFESRDIMNWLDENNDNLEKIS